MSETRSKMECAFFIPLRRDKNLSDGDLHAADVWDWLDDQLWEHFEAGTFAPGIYRGFYMDPDTGERIHDESYKYLVAIPDYPAALDSLRVILREACHVFCQKCIYLSISGKVEFIGEQEHDST